jgi:heat shock protein HtpX
MFEEVRKNKIRSFILMFIFVILIASIGAAIGMIYGSLYIGLIIAGLIALVYTLIGFFSGDKIVLGTSGAKEVTKKQYPHLFHTVEGLALAAGVPTPKSYVIDDSALNAFATGRDPKHSSITVTTGLLKTLNRQELEGVIAHEMSHIKNYDVRFMMLIAVLIGLITLLSDFMFRSFIWGPKGRKRKDMGKATIVIFAIAIVLAILSPIIGQIVKFAISRKREYMADANGALLTRYPPGLAGALRKISKDPDPLVDKANKATAHLFISTPFRKKNASRLFMTHPDIKDRIRRLEEM